MRTLDDKTSGTLCIGDDLVVRCLGFGAMRISDARNSKGVRDRDDPDPVAIESDKSLKRLAVEAMDRYQRVERRARP